MIEFKENPLDIGTIEKGSTVTVIFEYTGDQSDIVHINPHCGCTAKLDWTSTPGKIFAEYTDTDTKAIDLAIFTTHYPSGVFTFIKALDVYLKDDEDLMVLNGLEKDYNPNKQKITLNFSGKIKLI